MSNFLILLSVIINFFSNSGEKNKLNGDWLMVCYSDAEVPFEKCAYYEHKEYIVRVNFKGDDVSGKLIGRTPNNSIHGDYKIENNKIFLENVWGTKVSELTEFGRVFYSDIKKINSFKADDDSLIFYYENNLKSMKFVRLPQEK